VSALLVLLDLQMPHLGGQEVLRRLRADTHTMALPVIVFINTRADEDQLSSYPQPTGFTRKPLTVGAFQAVSTSLGLTTWT
jgi:CheY-like chemotaxis protein